MALQQHLENRAIAERLDSLETLLELAGASPYATRAYRRAAELIRSTEAPVADLIRAGRVRELRGIGPGIEARLRELVETGEIAELEELEREVQPDLVGLGRYLGIGAKQAVHIARTLGVRTAAELRDDAGPGPDPLLDQTVADQLAIGVHDRASVDPQFLGHGPFRRQPSGLGERSGEDRLAKVLVNLPVHRHDRLAVELRKQSNRRHGWVHFGAEDEQSGSEQTLSQCRLNTQ